VQGWFDPLIGVSTKRPGKDAWWNFCAKGRVSPVRLRKHAAGKESLAVTWGPWARVRVIDADAHGKASPLDALPTLWDAIRALHLGRGTYVGPLVDGEIPADVVLDGVIVTSPRGLHYIEITLCPSDDDTQADDKARVTFALRDQCVPVRYGELEVLPSSNGQSRLPLGHGCEFVYPLLGKIDLETGVAVLRGLRPVSRTFDALGPCPQPTAAEVAPNDLVGVGANQCEAANVHESRASLAWKRFAKARHGKMPASDLGDTLYEGRGYLNRSTKRSAFVEQMKQVLANGADVRQRNSQFWNLCILLRLTWGLSRADAEKRIAEWIDNAPHTSRDLRDRTKRRAAHRLLRKHLNTIDAGLVSGRFYQHGFRKLGGPISEPLLLVPETNEEVAELERIGDEYLCGTSFLSEAPAWAQRGFRQAIGGILKWSRDGRIVIPGRTLQVYARTKQTKRCPFTGKMVPAYKVLRTLVERAGVIGGVVAEASREKRLAAVYESHVGQDVKPEKPVVDVASWPKHRNVKRKDATWKREPFGGRPRVLRASLRRESRLAHVNRVRQVAKAPFDHWLYTPPIQSTVAASQCRHRDGPTFAKRFYADTKHAQAHFDNVVFGGVSPMPFGWNVDNGPPIDGGPREICSDAKSLGSAFNAVCIEPFWPALFEFQRNALAHYTNAVDWIDQDVGVECEEVGVYELNHVRSPRWQQTPFTSHP
jgi:hypothetical protein